MTTPDSSRDDSPHSDDVCLGGRLCIRQSRTGYRFNFDSLLIAATANQLDPRVILDVGAGSGVIGLALLCSQDDRRAIFVERQRGLFCHLTHNVAAAGLDARASVELADIRELADALPRVDVVVINPPYFRPGEGRTGPPGERQDARFQNHGSIDELLAAAAKPLEREGHVCLSYPSRRLDDALEALNAAGLRRKTLRFVHPAADAPANLVIVTASKRRRSETVVIPALQVYAGPNVYSDEALSVIDGTWMDAAK